jgi:hypothetical protein
MSFKSVDIIGNNSSRDQFDWFFIYKWLQMLFSVWRNNGLPKNVLKVGNLIICVASLLTCTIVRVVNIVHYPDRISPSHPVDPNVLLCSRPIILLTIQTTTLVYHHV